jgi:uncharacterized membrane protein
MMGKVIMTTAAESGIREEQPRAGAICYLFGILFPLVYLFCVPRRQQQRFLRFHSIQCLMLFALIGPLVWWGRLEKIAAVGVPLLLIAWLVAMIQAGRGKILKLPILGQMAAHLSLKTHPPVL